MGVGREGRTKGEEEGRREGGKNLRDKIVKMEKGQGWRARNKIF